MALETVQETLTISTPTEKAAYNKKPTAFGVAIQKTAGWLVLLPFCGLIAIVLRFVAKYRIERMEEFRRAYYELCKSDQPLLICANHLTFIDSVLIIWASAFNGWYLFNYKKFTWNLPAGGLLQEEALVQDRRLSLQVPLHSSRRNACA